MNLQFLSTPAHLLAILAASLFSQPALAETSSLAQTDTGTLIHIVSSVIAFGVLSLAGVYAILVLAIDHSLKKHRLSRLVKKLPPLDKLEKLLFQLILVGFLLLTVTLISGLIYVDDLMAQHLAHKTILSILAWIVFGALLLGRRIKGWRGAIAIRMTLAGVALLLLADVGSKLVLEVILGKSWYS